MKINQFLFGITCVAVLAASNLRADDLKVGDPAPDFKLEGSDGKMHELSEYKGKQAVVLAWFPKAFTGGCTAECKSIKENSAALKKYDVAYFTASVDPMEGDKGNKAFAKSLEVDYPILSDPTMETAKAYGVVNSQRLFAQRWTFYIGKDGKILYIDKTVKPANSAQDMIAKFKELGISERN